MSFSSSTYTKMTSHIFHLLVDAANDCPDASITFNNLDPSSSPKEFSYLELLEKAKVCADSEIDLLGLYHFSSLTISRETLDM